METRANYVLVGLFTLLVVLAAFGFVYWFASAKSSGNRQTVDVVFTGSVSGLTNGGYVLFNGLRVGEVKKIALLPNDPKSVVATVIVDAATPIRTDTVARLEYQGLTGAAQVALSGGSANAPPLEYVPGFDNPVIHAQRSDIQDLVETARAIARKADGVLTGLEEIVSENKGGVSATVQNIERFSRSLGDNSDGIDKFLEQVGAAAERVGPLAERLESLSKHLDEVVVAFDSAKVNQIVSNLASFSGALSENREKVSETLTNVAELSKSLRELTPKLENAVREGSELLKGIDRQKVANVIDNLDRVSGSLASKRLDIEQTLTSAREISDKLNKTAGRIDELISSAEAFLGSASGEAGKSAFDEIKDAARSVRELADNLDKRTAEIAASLTRFGNSGLKEYEGLAVEARRAVNEINRAVRSIERNPQQFIFGDKPSMPQYNGRR